MHSKKHLSFGSLREAFSNILLEIEDKRVSGKVNYSIHDAMMSALACMFFQEPSLVEFQRQLEKRHHKNNLQTIFNVAEIPTDNQIREIIDEISSKEYEQVFAEYFSRLQRGKHLKQYEYFRGYYICAIDGTQYFSSDKINCSGCLTKEHKNGTVTYSHQVLQAAIVNPNMRQVIPLMPEEIRNTDGNDKQDCEINAGKRLIPKIRSDHPQLNLIITGDSLYSKQPFIETVEEQQMHYILVAKPKDHKSLMEWLDVYDEAEWGQLEHIDDKGKKHVYEWMNDVPLNGREDTIKVNYFRYRIESDEKGKKKTTYKNSWVTDINIVKGNVKKLVKAGRAKWKIENECFNTLKNQGYHITHNYGHGKKNLCFNFFLITLLAFFIHQIAELTDKLYQGCRKMYVNKKLLWDRLRFCIELLIYENWEHLLNFLLDPEKYNVSAVKT